MILKMCGMRDPENIRQLDRVGIDWMGFIFYPRSPRYVEKLPDFMPVHARRVGVFVDERPEETLAKAKEFGLDYLQLHGTESPEYCCRLRDSGLRIIKAFRIETANDLKAVAAYEGICSYFLFDAKTPAYGGSGKTFDWTVLDGYSGETPFLLSGGIGPEHFEQAPGIKDVKKATQFIQNMKRKK